MPLLGFELSVYAPLVYDHPYVLNLGADCEILTACCTLFTLRFDC